MSVFVNTTVNGDYLQCFESYRGGVLVTAAGTAGTVTIFKTINGIRIPLATGDVTCDPPLQLSAAIGGQAGYCVEVLGECIQLEIAEANLTVDASSLGADTTPPPDFEHYQYCNPATDTLWRRVVQFAEDGTETILTDADLGLPCAVSADCVCETPLGVITDFAVLCGTTPSPTPPPVANNAPILASPLIGQIVTVNQPLTMNVAGNFTDPDGDTLTYSATNLPLGVTIDTATGEISGTPTALGIGTATVTATDPGGLSASGDIILDVIPALTFDAAATALDASVNPPLLRVTFTELIADIAALPATVTHSIGRSTNAAWTDLGGGVFEAALTPGDAVPVPVTISSGDTFTVDLSAVTSAASGAGLDTGNSLTFTAP